MPPTVIAIVLAGGRGRRFGADENKVFAPLGSTTVLGSALAAFERCQVVDRLVCVGHADDLARVADTAAQAVVSKPFVVVEGGDRRVDSERAGLMAVNGPPDATFVAIHDAARPLVTPELIERVVTAAEETGGAVPGVAIDQPLVDANGDIVDRGMLRAMQTPQVFRLDLLLEAYALPPAGGLDTADVVAAHRPDLSIICVEGEPDNLKITHSDDLDRAERIRSQGSRRS